ATRSAASISAPIDRPLRHSQRAVTIRPIRTSAAIVMVMNGFGCVPLASDATMLASPATSSTTTRKKPKTPRRNRRPASNRPSRAHGGEPEPQGGPCPCWSGIGEPVADAVHRQDVPRPAGLGLDLLAEVLHVCV